MAEKPGTEQLAENDSRRDAHVALERHRTLAFDHLRAFVIVLVVLQHSILAYMASASVDRTNPVIGTFLVADSSRWIGMDVLAVFNDVFFMALMFFISGLFVWQALARKGAGRFLKDRLLRLGVPFLVVATFVTPLAVYPAILATRGHVPYLAYWKAMLTRGPWPSGPVWFLWLLLAFDSIAALAYLAWPAADRFLKRRCSTLFGRPIAFFGLLIAVSLAAYLPMVLAFGPYRWFGQGLGPFWVQSSRVLLYPAYFAVGVAVGAYGVQRSLFADGGPLATASRRWRTVGLAAFLVAATVIGMSPSRFVYGVVFVPACTAMGLALISIFLRHADRTNVIWDDLAANSYGIFLVHYPFVIWLQYLLLGAALPAVVKAAVVFVCALGLSWGSTALLRRIPAVARVV